MTHRRKDTSIKALRAPISGAPARSWQRPAWLGTAGLLSALLMLSGCETLGYYTQAIRGQMAVTFARVPVTRLLDQPATSEALKQRLQTTQAMLAYIERELGLSSGRRYRSYVALEQDAVLYNLVATPQLSLNAHQWCYPIAGCAPYRGYFKRAAALAAAERYAARGFTTYVGRVPAYSTLGWFKDPLLSSFIHWSDAELIALLAHELSHSRIWVDSDVGFNEAFASFVGEQTARDWSSAHSPRQLQEYEARRAGWLRLVHLQQQLKEQLQVLYGSSLAIKSKQAASRRLYETFRQCYRQHLPQLGGGRFDRYVTRLNDAALAALATYRDDIPAFAALFAQSGGRWPAFFAAVDEIARLPPAQRRAAMQDSGKQQITEAADDHGTDQIQCQALANHGVDGDLT